MSRRILFAGLVLAVTVGGFAIASTQGLAKKHKHRVERSRRPPSLALAADPTTLRNCGEDARVRLVATASSAEGGALRYKWNINGGRLVGEGPNTTWDLSGAQPGLYQAVVEVDDGRDQGCVAFSSANVLVTECPPIKPVPVCPTISISCPEVVSEDQPLTFTARISGGSGGMTQSYNWTVTAGRIISGQGTPQITVDAHGLAGQTVRASIDVSGYGVPCEASCATSLPIPIKPKKFDEYPNIARNDEKARLDNFAIQLQSEPTAQAYVIVHPSRRARPGEAQARAKRISDYLVNSRGLDAGRIVTTIDGPSDDWLFELWIVPQGASPPR